jgi:hypothetical protein
VFAFTLFGFLQELSNHGEERQRSQPICPSQLTSLARETSPLIATDGLLVEEIAFGKCSGEKSGVAS